jgi:hypothetical protein
VLRDRDLEAALDEAASVTIARQVETEVRTRLGDLSPEILTPLQLIERYFESLEEEPERIQALLGKAEEIILDSN